MTILKEREAVDYLQRARSCLHPEKDSFFKIPLLASMIDIEIAYIERAIKAGPEELSMVSIDSTGFPELPSFITDMTKAFAIGDLLQGDRIKALKPWLNQFQNFSLEGIISASEKPSSVMDQDYQLMQVLEQITPETRSLILDRKPPFYLNDNFPGVIFTEFLYHEQSAGFKYIDSRKNPTIFFMQMSDLGTAAILGLTPEVYVSCYEGEKYNVYTCRIHNKVWRDCPCSSHDNALPHAAYSFSRSLEFKEGYVPENSKNAVMKLIEKIDRMHPLVRKFYLGLDTSCFSGNEIDFIFDNVYKFSDLVNTYIESANLIIKGKVVSGEQFQNSSFSLAKGFNDVLEVLPNLELQSGMRLTIAAVTQEIKDKMRAKELELALTSVKTNLAIPQPAKAPRRKFLGLF